MGMHVALLRGINVGGKNKVPMKLLAELFGLAGAEDVRTYIQSGNVVFGVAGGKAQQAKGAERIEKGVAEQMEKRLGFAPVMVVRSAAELTRAIQANPFPEASANHKALHLGFLKDKTSPARIAKLDPARSPGDSVAVIGSEVYLWTPDGVADSKFTSAYFDSALETTVTFRNWRTVGVLAEMTGTPA